MKVLYGIQGTGNGHLTRAMEIIPALRQRAEVDVLISGIHSELSLPFEVKYRFHGLGFVFGKKGGIDLYKTYRKNRLKRFYTEVKKLDLSAYDFVITDFEPITAWAAMRQNKLCIGLSNQASLLHPLVPKATGEDFVGRFIIRNYAPASVNFGFSYRSYEQQIFTPIIRQSVRKAVISDQGHITVYLPSYADDRIISVLSAVENAQFQVFSKNTTVAYTYENLRFLPLSTQAFEQSFTRARGVITAAGFGTTTEALYLGKPLLVIPQKNQYEQACNALALKELGVRVVKSLKEKHLEKIRLWVEFGEPVKIDYPDQLEQLVNEIIYTFHTTGDAYNTYITTEQFLLKSGSVA